MVLYYGLLALETANNTVAATKSSSERENILRKNPMSSSSNSWIYTEDLRKRFEERYGDCRYIVVPIYIKGKSSHHNSSTTTIIPENFHSDNSWMYSKSFRNHLFNSTSKISLSNQIYIKNDLPIKKNFFHRFSSLKHKPTNTNSSSILNTKNTLLEDDDENTEHENHSIPLIKHNSIISSDQTSNDNPSVIDQSINTKHTSIQNNRLTRLRSFFFKSSTSSLSGTQ